jgi:signal transduction histidine kinase
VIHDGVVATLGFGAGARSGKVMSACEDADGGVWLYTADGQIGRFFGDGLALVGQSKPSLCRSVIADGAGRIWVGSDFGQVAFGRVATNGRPPLLGLEIPAAKLDFLLASRGGGFWRLGDGRIEKWGTNQLERMLAHYGSWTNVPNARITSACEDSQGNLIVGVLNAGVFWFDTAGRATRISTEQVEGGLSHSGVLSVGVDREGDLWVGTDGGGLNRVKRRVGVVASETQGRVVQSVCEDAEGALWIGFNGGGAMRWKDGVARDFGWDRAASQHRLEDGLVSPNVSAVFADKSGQVWVGTRAPGGLHQFRDGKFELVEVAGSFGPEISAMHQDRAGRLWLGSPEGLLCRDGQRWKMFTTADGLSTNAVRAIADDGAGNLWIGTLGGGLNCLRDGNFTVFRKAADGLPGNNISSLLVDGEGTLWVGTSSGLARFKNGRWAQFTAVAGLPSNKINYLAEDGEGFLWIGSNVGLVRVAKSSLEEFAAKVASAVACRAYDEADGLPTSECTDGSQPAALRTRAGKLWFPTIKGLVGIEPSELKRNTNPPPVIIESVLLDGREQLTNGLRAALPSEIVVPPEVERLEIQFASLNLAAPERAQFRYQLEQHESRWSSAATRREAQFTKLPPGRYVFHVAAGNEDGVWNNVGASLVVRVLPPFWRTWWFLSLSVLAVLGLVAGTVHFISTQKLQRQLAQLKQKESLERERSRIARDLHDQLGANLTRVSLLGELVESDKNEPAEVEQHARQISKTASETQHALDEIVWAANPANDTLEGLVNYICKYAQEFLTTAGLRCRLDVPADLPATAIAPEFRHNVFLVAKESVNNVVKHAQASAVRVQIKLEAGALVMEVEDDGRGPEGAATATERGSNGLRNMSRRMEDIGGTFSLEPAPERGSIVRLTAPLKRR